jgi:hypothetical protein
MPYAFREHWDCSAGRRQAVLKVEVAKSVVSFENSEKSSLRKRPSPYSQILATAPTNPTEVIVC